MPVNRELEPLTLHVETRKDAIHIEDSADQGRLRALGSFKHGLRTPRCDDQEPLLEPRRVAPSNLADAGSRLVGLVGESHGRAYVASTTGK
jgi:hypothetical protein